MNTTDAGSQARTSPPDQAPVQRLAELRATLLGGRGQGASNAEVTEHTRDRPWLGAVPAPVERALVERQAEHLRAGEPIVNRRVRREHQRAGRRRSWQAALLGAALALTTRALVARRAASKRQQRL